MIAAKPDFTDTDDKTYEELTWAPNVNDSDLIACLRTAR